METAQNFAIPLLSGLATMLGGLSAAVSGRLGAGAVPVLLGLSSGIGFVVVFFDILPEAVKIGSWIMTAAGFTGGIVFGSITEKVFPQVLDGGLSSRPGWERGRRRIDLLRTGYLFAIGVAAHNLPEGMAVGAGLEARAELGILLATAIGLHNIPEGMALSGVFMAGGKKPFFSVALAAGAGLILPAGALLTQTWFSAGPQMIAFLLAMGAGALLYIIINELLPSSLSMHPRRARFGIAAGVAVSLAFSIA